MQLNCIGPSVSPRFTSKLLVMRRRLSNLPKQLRTVVSLQALIEQEETATLLGTIFSCGLIHICLDSKSSSRTVYVGHNKLLCVHVCVLNGDLRRAMEANGSEESTISGFRFTRTIWWISSFQVFMGFIVNK